MTISCLTSQQTVGAGDLLEVVQSEIRGCRDVARLCAAAIVLCRLLQSSERVRDSALLALLRLLVSGLPRVSKFPDCMIFHSTAHIPYRFNKFHVCVCILSATDVLALSNSSF